MSTIETEIAPRFAIIFLKTNRQLSVTNLIVIEVEQGDFRSVFESTLSNLVQIRPPTGVFDQIFGSTFGQQNVAGIAAAHDALGNVDSGSGRVRSVIDIRNMANRTAVNSHPYSQGGAILESL